MASNGAPESWDDMDVSDKMNNLNVNAPSFVPNVNAAVFVPGGFGGQQQQPAPAANTEMQVDQPPPAAAEVKQSSNGGGAAPADSWEDKADMSTPATTPEDEDVSMEDDSGQLTVHNLDKY